MSTALGFLLKGSGNFFAGTFLGCCVIAVFISIQRPETSFLATFLYSQSVGQITCLLCMLVLPKVKGGNANALDAVLWLTGACVLGTIIGNAVGVGILRYGFGIQENLRGAFASIWISLACGAIGSLFFYNRERLKLIDAELQAQRWRSEAIQKQAVQAQLQMLQAQIEPHFLFNTLAHVSAAMDESVDSARDMLSDLVTYLRGSLAHARASHVTLAQELILNQQLLGIMQHRLGNKLVFELFATDEVSHIKIAPMLIQPLVENAVKHGVEPSIQPVHIKVAAQAQAGDLLIEVADTGPGFDTPGQGTGLENIVQRLHALYGPQAQFSLQRIGQKTLATLRIPMAALTTT
jgi:signal transduction histidine kinase